MTDTATSPSPLLAAVLAGGERLVRHALDSGAPADDSVLYSVSSAGVARVLVDAGMSPNITDEHGCTPLMTAARDGLLGVVEVLVERADDINATDDDGKTALYCACVSRRDGRAKVAQVLIDHGANVDIPNRHGITPLMAAVYQLDADLLDVLIRSGANVDATNNDGDTALALALNTPLETRLRN